MKKVLTILCACFFSTIFISATKVEDYMDFVDDLIGFLELHVPCKSLRELLRLIPDKKIRMILLKIESELSKLNIVPCGYRRDSALED